MTGPPCLGPDKSLFALVPAPRATLTPPHVPSPVTLPAIVGGVAGEPHCTIREAEAGKVEWRGQGRGIQADCVCLGGEWSHFNPPRPPRAMHLCS